MAVSRNEKERLRRIYDRLGRLYGKRRRTKNGTLLEQLILTILTSEAKETYALKAMQVLQERYVDWNEVRICSIEHLHDELRPTGVNSHAPKLLKNTLEMLLHELSTLDPIAIDDYTAAEVCDLLSRIRFPAALQASFLLAQDTLPGSHDVPIDDSVARVMERIGLVKDARACSEIRNCLKGLPQNEEHNFHRVAANLATAFCKEEPLCAKCPVRMDCQSHGTNGKTSAKTGGRDVSGYRQTAAARQSRRRTDRGGPACANASASRRKGRRSR